MTNRIPLIVNAGAAQIQEIAASDTLQVPGNLTANVVQTDNYQYANGTPINFGGTYGNSNVTTLLNSGAFTGNIIPNGNATQSLGNATNQWADLWVSNATIYLDSIPLGVSNVGVLQFNGNDIVTSGPNVVNTGNVETTGNVSGAYILGDGSQLANIATGNNGAIQVNWQGALSNQGGTPGDTYTTLQFDGDGLLDINGNTAYQPRVDATPYITVNTPRVESEDFGIIAGPAIQVVGYDDSYNTPRSAYLSLQDRANVTQQWNFGILGYGSNNFSIVDATANATWSFGTDGGLTFPDSSVQTTAANTGNLLFNGLSIYANANAVGNAVSVNGTYQGYAFLELPVDAVANTNNVRLHNNAGNVQIVTAEAGGNVSYNWTFNKLGRMGLPFGSNINTPDGGNLQLNAQNELKLTTGAGGNTWTFGTDGSLTAPGDITTTANISGGYVLGNGSQLTGLPAGYSNADVATFLGDFGSNTITTTGNISVGDVTLTNLYSPNFYGNAITYANANGYLTNTNVFKYDPGTEVLTVGNVSTTGNVTGGIFTANILVGDGGNIANITGANVTGEVAVANTVSNPTQANITQVGTLQSLEISGQFTANGNAQFNQDVYFAGNVTLPGNINQISGNSATFFGNVVTGFGALYAGIPAGYTPLINEVVQFADNYNGYTQVTHQNLSGGDQATGDFVITANNGTDLVNHIDMGIAGSGYNGLLANNSLGTSLYANDGYLYTKGNVSGGNLILGSNQANGVVRIIANGASNISDVVATFSANGLTMIGDISVAGVASPAPVINGFSFRGPNVSAAGNVTGGNVLTGGIVSASGNVTGNYLLGNGYYIPNVNAVQVVNGTSNVTVPTTNGNIVVTVAGTATSTFDTAGNFRLPGNVITPAGMLAEGNIYTESWLVANNQGVEANQLNVTGNASVTGNITGDYATFSDITLNDLAANAILYTDANRNVFNTDFSYDSTTNTMSGGNISITGNVTAGYFYGDGSNLTGVGGNYGDSNVSTYLASGNNSAGYSTTGNVTANYLQTASGSSSNITGANYIDANYFVGDGSLLTNITVSTTYGDSNVVTLLSNFGSNVVSTTGNVTASYVVGDGSQLTNLPTPAPVIGTTASGATITPTGSSTQYNVTALAVAADFAAPSGSPEDGQKLTIRIIDNGTPQTLSWNAIYQVIGTTLPTTTVASKYTYVGLIYNGQASKWDVVSVAQQA